MVPETRSLPSHRVADRPDGATVSPRRRLARRVAALVLGLAALTAQATPFPRPAELEPDIRFWTRVFTEIDTGGGFLHDNRRLDGRVSDRAAIVSRRLRTCRRRRLCIFPSVI